MNGIGDRRRVMVSRDWTGSDKRAYGSRMLATGRQEATSPTHVVGRSDGSPGRVAADEAIDAYVRACAGENVGCDGYTTVDNGCCATVAVGLERVTRLDERDCCFGRTV